MSKPNPAPVISNPNSTPLLDSLFVKGGITTSGGNWDEINDTECRIADIISRASRQVMDIVHASSDAKTGDNEFFILSNGISRDLQEFTRQFVVLREKRKDRSGPTLDNQDYTDYISLGVEYTQMLQDLSHILAPALYNLTEYYSNALTALAQSPEVVMAKAQDVNVISDVAIKMVDPV